jgi:hypothetical protein
MSLPKTQVRKKDASALKCVRGVGEKDPSNQEKTGESIRVFGKTAQKS